MTDMVRVPSRRKAPWAAVAVVLGSLLLLAGGGAARADCWVTRPELVWSYPPDGSTGVPTNSRIWLLLDNWYLPPEVRLNGVPVPRQTEVPFGYAAVLEPSTEYQVRFLAARDSEQELGFRFSTGQGPSTAGPPEAPVIAGMTATSRRDLSARCRAVLNALDCHDLGQNTHLIFHSASRPLLWLVERVSTGRTLALPPWPGECGDPEVYVESRFPAQCSVQYRLHAVDGTGLRSVTEPVCRDDATVVPAEPPGCAVGGPAAGGAAPLVLMVALGLAAGGRRRRR